MPERARIAVVGLWGEDAAGLAPAGRQALGAAALVVGGRRHLALAPPGVPTAAIEGDVAGMLDAVAASAGPVCVLASGDPGFFGIVRPLAARFGAEALEVHPAPSAVSLAFARLGLSWDDATVVSAHGRPFDAAVRLAAGPAKVAVLASPDDPPEALGKALLGLGVGPRRVAVCSRLGLAAESVTRTDLDGLAAGTWDPLSVVVLLAGDGVAAHPSPGWGLADEAFEHRDGMITKAEVRAVVLAKLALPAAGVVWDIGAGSGSVAVECARVRPGLRLHAVERRPDDADRIRVNAAAQGVHITVTEGEAPSVLDDLPDPERAFVGGGGIHVLDAVVARLRPGGRLVATYAALDRAAAAADRLGSLVQIGVAKGERLPDGGLRLVAENPVFVVWGPEQ